MKQEYNVIAEGDFNNFVQAVNGALAEGWTCQGGVFVTKTIEPATLKSKPSFIFYQSVVRGKTEKM